MTWSTIIIMNQMTVQNQFMYDLCQWMGYSIIFEKILY